MCLTLGLILILTLSFLLSVQTMGHMKVIQFQGNAKASSPPPMNLKPVANPDLTPSPDVPLAILKRKMMSTNDIRAARGLLMEINAHLKVKISQYVACLRSSVPCRSDLTEQIELLPWQFSTVSEHVCVQVREMMADTMRQVVERVTGNRLKAEEALNDRTDLTQHQCYKAAVNHYKYNCFNWHKPEVDLHTRILQHIYLNQIPSKVFVVNVTVEESQFWQDSSVAGGWNLTHSCQDSGSASKEETPDLSHMLFISRY